MKPDHRFDFVVDRAAHTITIRRDFAAPKEMVWDCYTRAELLDRWFSPAPMTTRTESMEFRPGGHWHYVMLDPGGAEYWSRLDYEEVEPTDRFTGHDGFTDATGIVNLDLPRAHVENRFTGSGDTATVTVVTTYASAEDIDTVVGMGIEAGMGSTLDRLDTLLADLQPERTRA
ncbi:SRPBCC domain-containing protein [Wenxinia saemankumensis]|uniref:Uncharacterized conserved protein YndB, AHSA1/START domain n=1 Tax=Wenxinia saemankumensis TaxID=1447782 RepID=A0A1M6GL83_9RHOB|nr:SRPBCC domain-containing protein [Wenxinia saemankumensis]SHJ10680.1 Uncharacterized conserved protein YndB, AHSA1/START domain [Wenxinia saemankumensis]